DLKIGWISIPSFYSSNADPTGKSNTRKSTTDDVAALLRRLINEGIDGLIIDLRKDGGGALEEAINLTGLFIPRGPVVQVKDTNGRIVVKEDQDERTFYNGPLIVLINRQSASASEIFAAALQDYGRALIVGDSRSFGKGTVQQVVDVSRFMPLFSAAASNAGSLKLTVQKFYRVKGGSTQLRGVESDIVLPSLTDSPEIGESALPNPLPYDEVAPRPIAELNSNLRSYLDELRARSQKRVSQEPEFRYIREDMQRLLDKIAANQISLNLQARKKEKEETKLREEKRKAERLARGPALQATSYELTLENVNSPTLTKVDFDRTSKKEFSFEEENSEEEEKADENAPPIPDAIRNETLLIARDLVELTHHKDRTKTAQN
ncbi:MAG: carboxy terminal-processing peptidase, partial [Chthoniobacterales bacterium]|nr:carboxy terminal-processing peptidase [Chthoniobacterales bacterium]